MPSLKDSHSKRDEIIEVASKLFYEQGYHRTGIQQIIQQANTAKGTFYSHFKSKDALGVAWLKEVHAHWNRWLNESLSGGKTAKEQILAMFDLLGSWMQETGFRGCAFLNTLAETPDRENPLRLEILEHKRGLRERFESLVRQHNPGLKDTESERLASTLFILFEGTLIEMQNFQEPWPLETSRAQVERLLEV